MMQTSGEALGGVGIQQDLLEEPFLCPKAPRSVQANTMGRWHMITVTLVGACDQDEAVVEHRTQVICSPNICHFSHLLDTCQSHLLLAGIDKRGRNASGEPQGGFRLSYRLPRSLYFHLYLM